MKRRSLRLTARISVLALIGAALVYAVVVAILADNNSFVVILLLILISMTALAATGRWWGLGVSAVLSGFMVLATASRQTDRLTDTGEAAERIGILLFLVLLSLAATSGAIASIATYRDRRRATEHKLLRT